jgi:UDP-4-amino-4,6-dideoxy-N-acetyl-beta-L-altrosamine N-acetyltransferase
MVERQKYRLRPIQEDDLQQVLEWRNSDRIRACMYTDDIISWDQHCKWFETTKGNPIVLHQVCEFQDRLIGVVNASRIDESNTFCHWGFYLGDLTVPKGSSYVMGLLFLDLLFDSLSLQKVYGEVLSFNADSIKYHVNIGFEYEEVLEKHVVKGSVSMDVIRFGLSSKRWYSVRSETENRLFDS